MAKGCSKLLFFFSFLMLALAINAQAVYLFHDCSKDVGNYTSNSAYGTNLNSVFSSISSNTVIDYGFYNESVGQEPDKVNAIVLCRGDVGKDDCRDCIKNSTQKILQDCPNQKQAIVWYDKCMLRYSNKSILEKLETSPSFSMHNRYNASGDLSEFNQVLHDLLRRLQTSAASENSLRKFAAGENTTSSFQKIYALVQCTPDLSRQQCITCLDDAIRQIPGCCSGRRGGRFIMPSCNFRFEDVTFYDPTANSPPPASVPPPQGFVLA